MNGESTRYGCPPQKTVSACSSWMHRNDLRVVRVDTGKCRIGGDAGGTRELFQVDEGNSIPYIRYV